MNKEKHRAIYAFTLEDIEAALKMAFNMPDDIHLDAAHWDWATERFLVRAEHPSFPIVIEGQTEFNLPQTKVITEYFKVGEKVEPMKFNWNIE